MKHANRSAVGMIGGMVLAWSIYYAVSKVVVGATGSALLAGFLLRSSALVFLTAQLLLDGSFSRLFHQQNSPVRHPFMRSISAENLSRIPVRFCLQNRRKLSTFVTFLGQKWPVIHFVTDFFVTK